MGTEAEGLTGVGTEKLCALKLPAGGKVALGPGCGGTGRRVCTHTSRLAQTEAHPGLKYQKPATAPEPLHPHPRTAGPLQHAAELRDRDRTPSTVPQ